MKEEEKNRHLKITIIVPCQICGENQYAEISMMDKYLSINAAVSTYTNLKEVSNLYGRRSRHMCPSCREKWEKLTDSNKEKMDRFFIEGEKEKNHA